MNKEIKEILDNVRKIIKSNRESEFNRIIYDCDGIEKILDYITNLQEENKRLKEYQENYRKELDYWRIQFSNKEDRIDKAIKYIENNKEKQFAYNYEYYLEDKEVEDILNILKGSEE